MSGNIIKRVIGVLVLSTVTTAAAPGVSEAAPTVVAAPVVAHTQLVAPATVHTSTVAAARPSLELRALKIAESKIGSPYVWGATGPWSFDCSGLVYYSYRKAGKHLPRTSEEMQRYARRVYSPQVGDLVFFGWPAYHVGIYVGHGKFLNAPHTGDSVEVDPIWYDGTPSSYGRIN